MSDVYGMDAFLRDFDMYFCKLSTVRGTTPATDAVGRAADRHYEKTRRPRTKTLVFSDSLTFPR